MALEQGIQSLPFVQGPDSKTDNKLSLRPAKLFNACFRNGSIEKRPGRSSIPNTSTNGERLFTHGDTLIRLDAGTLYGYAAHTQAWVALPGGGPSATVSVEGLIAAQQTTAGFDQAQTNGVTVVAWGSGTTAAGGIHVSVFDTATGAVYQSGQAVVSGSTSACTTPKCVVLGSKVLILFADYAAGKIYSAVVDSGSPTTTPTATAIRTDVYTLSVVFDAIAYNSSYAVVGYATTINKLELIGVDTTGAVTASPAATDTGAGTLSDSLKAGILIQRDTAGNLYAIAGDVVNLATAYIVRSSTFAAVLGKTNIVTNGNWSGGAADFGQGTTIELVANSITLVVSGNRTVGGHPFNNALSFMGTAVLTSAGVGTAFSELSSTAGLVVAGGAIAYGASAVLAVINTDFGGNFTPSYGVGIQSTVFLITTAGAVVGRVLLDQSNSAVQRVATPVTDGFSVSYLVSDQLRTQYISDGHVVTNVSPLGISRLTLTPALGSELPVTQVGASTYLGGALPRVFDGIATAEAGFALFPTVTQIADAGAGGNLSAGTYQWKALYSVVLANGELMRGIVSPPFGPLTLAASHKATIGIGSMPLSMRDILAVGATVQIEVYRTTANGSVFYRASSVTAPTYNATTYAGTTAGQIVITDNLADTDLVVGELLYTTGGVLDWEAPPAYGASCAHKGRLIIAALEDPHMWMPSSVSVEGQTVRFSSQTAGVIRSDTGPLVNVASMDGRILLFTTETAFVVLGDGPDLLGQNPYSEPERVISVDAGPLPGTPIVETPLGLMYQTDRGIMLLDRALNTELAGADVLEWTVGPWRVRSALLDSEREEVRFLADPGSDIPGAQTGELVPGNGGVALVFNYFYKQWAVWADYGGQSSCLYQGRYTMTRSDGLIWQEEPGSFRDAGAYYDLSVETPWIKLSGLQGFQRLWYATLLGTYGSDFTLTWEVAYNYESTDPSTPVWEEVVTLDGVGLFTLGGQYQVRHHLGKKCVAVKFRLSDGDVRGNGSGLALSDLTLEYGTKKGAFKLPATQTI